MDKRAAKKAWKEAQREQARAAFPLPTAQLTALFAAVEAELDRVPCDHSRRLTSQWLAGQTLDADAVLQWLDETSGFCDCEVVHNSRDHFEQNAPPGTGPRG